MFDFYSFANDKWNWYKKRNKNIQFFQLIAFIFYDFLKMLHQKIFF